MTMKTEEVITIHWSHVTSLETPDLTTVTKAKILVLMTCVGMVTAEMNTTFTVGETR